MDSASTLTILALLAGAAWLWQRRRSSAVRQADARLRRICHGDDAQAERLIDGELTRSPGISRAEAASRAVLRFQRDNR